MFGFAPVTPTVDMNFWSQFWPSLAANMIAGLTVLVVAYAFVRWYRQPSLRVEAHLRGASAGQLEVEVMARSLGRMNFAANEIYWHVFIDDRLDITSITQDPELDKQLVADNVMKHFRGAIDGPLFPNRPWGLLRMTIRQPQSGVFGLHYFISTAHGQFPVYLRRLKDGEARLRSLPCFADVGQNGLAPHDV